MSTEHPLVSALGCLLAVICIVTFLFLASAAGLAGNPIYPITP